MITSDKRYCRLTEEGLTKWSKNNIEADPRQVFTIEYESTEHLWIKVWWNQSAIMPPDMVKEVFWDEALGDYV